MRVQSVKPVFGDNYDVGYIGFTFISDSLLSTGIAWFTRWDRLGSIPVSHCFTVSGDGMCIEAHAGIGVVEAPIAKYFDDPHCNVFFRKPIGWNMVAGYTQRDLVWGQIGCKYDFGAVTALGLTGTIAGRFVNEAGFGVPEELIGRLLQDDKAWMCSELSSYALKKVYGPKGCLAKPTYTIEPQELFEDEQVFEGWKRK